MNKYTDWYWCAGDHHRVYLIVKHEGRTYEVSTGSHTCNKVGEKACLERLEKLMQKHLPDFTMDNN